MPTDDVESDDDDFFGDDDDEHDQLSEKEMQAQQQDFHKLGYLEAFDESKEHRLQEGFEVGYQQAFGVSVRIGELLAEASLDNKKEVVRLIRTSLEAMERSEVKSRRNEELVELETKVLELLRSVRDGE